MEEEKPVDQNSNQDSRPVIVKKSNNFLLAGAIIFLALVVAGAAIYLKMEKPTEKAFMTVSPTITSSGQMTKKLEPTPTPTDTISNWETANISKLKDLSFPAYSIRYPTGWVAKEIKDIISQTFTLTKEGNIIKISQIPTGGNLCIFEGVIPEGPANDYRNVEFIEIETKDALLRRIPGNSTHSFCSNSPQSKESFGIPTIYGLITYTLNSENNEIILEMDKILSTLKTAP